MQSTFAISRLTFADGHVLESSQSGGTGTGPAPAEAHPLQPLFPADRVLPVPTGNAMVPIAALVAAGDEEIGRYGETPGRLTSRISYNLARTRIVGAMPLAVGGQLRDGALCVDILRIEGRHGGCSVGVRYWRTSSPSSPSPSRIYELVLRNARRREAVVGVQMLLGGGVAPSSLPFRAIGWRSSGSGEEGFEPRHIRVEYPAREEGQTAIPALDRDWLAHAELVVVETMDAGWLTKSVTVDKLTIQPAAAVSMHDAPR